MTKEDVRKRAILSVACHIASHFSIDDQITADLQQWADETLKEVPKEDQGQFFHDIQVEEPALTEFLKAGTNCLELQAIFLVGEVVRMDPVAAFNAVDEILGLSPEEIKEVPTGITIESYNSKRVFIVPPTNELQH